jgi:hypothetical protein
MVGIPIKAKGIRERVAIPFELDWCNIRAAFETSPMLSSPRRKDR